MERTLLDHLFCLLVCSVDLHCTKIRALIIATCSLPLLLHSRFLTDSIV